VRRLFVSQKILRPAALQAEREAVQDDDLDRAQVGDATREMPDAWSRLDLNLRDEEGKLLEFGNYGGFEGCYPRQRALDARPRPMWALTGRLLRIDVGLILRRWKELC